MRSASWTRSRIAETLDGNRWRQSITMARMQEDSTESAVAPREIRARKWTYVVELVLVGFLLVVSVLVALNGWPEGGSSSFLGSLLPRLGAAIGGTWLSLFLGYNVVRLLHDPRPALQISEEGVLNRTYSWSAKLVPWEDILEIRKSRLPVALEMVLRDPEAFRRRQTLSTRIWMRVHARFSGPGRFMVYLPQLNASKAEVLHQLVAALDAFELAPVRDQRLLDDPDGPQ